MSDITYADACLRGLTEYNCAGCGTVISVTRRDPCDNCSRIAQSELEQQPFHRGLLAENELPDYDDLHRAIHRHAFYDHDCQTTTCRTMHLLNSQEFTRILHRAYQRGLDAR